MSIKQVTCPSCRTAMNVMSSMASAKCQSCGQVFSVNAPATTTPQQSGGAPRKSPQRADSDSNKMVPWLVFGGVFLVAIGGIGIMTFALRGGGDSTRSEPAAPAPQTDTTAEQIGETGSEQDAGPPTYKIVELPEGTRKKIYLEYNAMMDSSLGKAKRIPKSGVAGQSLRNMLGETVDRELTHMALVYGIEEDDIQEIIAEGNHKGW